MGKRKDLSDFEKGQIVMATRLSQSVSKTASLVGVSGMQWFVPAKSGGRRDSRWTSARLMGAQGSVMHLMSEG